MAEGECKLHKFPHLVCSRLPVVLVQHLVDKPIVFSRVSSAENEESRVPTTNLATDQLFLRHQIHNLLARLCKEAINCSVVSVPP